MAVIAAGQSGLVLAAPPFVAPPPPPAASPPPGTDRPGLKVGDYSLRRTPAGEYVHDHEWWSATIALDGLVTFENHRLRVGIQPPLIVGLFDRQRSANDWRDRDARQRLAPHRPDQNIHDRHERNDPFYRNHSTERPDAASLIGLLVLPSISIRTDFDLTDEMMRLVGQDPYRYEKAKFLAATSEMRVRMAVERHQELVRESLAELPARLEALWGNPRLTKSERRRVLLLLGQELDEDDPAGARALAIIEAFVKKHGIDVNAASPTRGR